MNSKLYVGIMALAASLMLASGATAQGTAPTAPAAPATTTPPAATAAPAASTAAPAKGMKIEKFNGVIENVDMSKKDVLVEYHKDKMSFSLNDKTKLYEGMKEMKLSDLTKGQWASVEYTKEGNQMIAHSIHVSPGKKSEPMASSGKPAEKMTSGGKAPEAK